MFVNVSDFVLGFERSRGVSWFRAVVMRHNLVSEFLLATIVPSDSAQLGVNGGPSGAHVVSHFLFVDDLLGVFDDLLFLFA
jgi:hypothetical protein